MPEWIEATFARAKAAKNESTWRKAGVAAKKAVTICLNENNQAAQRMGMSSREAIEAVQQKDYWAEQADLADVKALATSPHADNMNENLDRANAIMKMTHKKFGSPVSPSMKEFMGHPSEATLKAAGKSTLIAMSAAEAEEELEGAEVFAKASTDAAALATKYNWNTSVQENINLSAALTSEVAEFFRALVAFKKEQESGAGKTTFNNVSNIVRPSLENQANQRACLTFSPEEACDTACAVIAQPSSQNNHQQKALKKPPAAKSTAGEKRASNEECKQS